MGPRRVDSAPLKLPPVNRDHDPLMCDRGVFALFQGANGAQVEVSILCELIAGHEGDHFAEGAGGWVDDDISVVNWPGGS